MMDLEKILKLVQAGDLDVEEAKKQIIKEGGAGPANLDLGFAQLDIDREKRTGFPEVIFGEGKTRRADRGDFPAADGAHRPRARYARRCGQSRPCCCQRGRCHLPRNRTGAHLV